MAKIILKLIGFILFLFFGAGLFMLATGRLTVEHLAKRGVSLTGGLVFYLIGFIIGLFILIYSFKR